MRPPVDTMSPEPSAPLTLPTRQGSVQLNAIPCDGAGGHQGGVEAEGGEAVAASTAASSEHTRHSKTQAKLKLASKLAHRKIFLP
jgi:hypothetical protein